MLETTKTNEGADQITRDGAGDAARESLQQLALREYHVCKSGNVVTRPQDCWKTDSLLPALRIEG